MSENGKGSRRRPCYVPRREFEARWDAAFRKKRLRGKRKAAVVIDDLSYLPYDPYSHKGIHQ
jgi:hypothetical protein